MSTSEKARAWDLIKHRVMTDAGTSFLKNVGKPQDFEHRTYQEYIYGYRDGYCDALIQHCSIISSSDPMTPLARRQGYCAGHKACVQEAGAK